MHNSLASLNSVEQPDPFLLAADLLDPPEVTIDPARDTPGAFARGLDPLVVQTPALNVVDRELVAIRDRIRVMFERRKVFANLVSEEDGEDTGAVQEAIQYAEQAVPDAGNGRLILSMPPQEGKTERVGRRGILWLLQQFPDLRVGLVSYDGDHAGRISYLARADIELYDGSDGNQDMGLRLAKNQKALTRWLLAPPSQGGGVYAIGIGGGLTGRPLDLLLIDDPVKDIRNADSVLLSSQAWEWWQTVARPRLAPWAPVILVQTRWHEADLAGRMIAKQQEDEGAGLDHYDRWRVINIPAQADHDPEKGETDVLGREPGEYMVSARGRTREQWEATKNATAPRFWTALYQGKPSPDVGDVWLKTWWRRYNSPLWSAQGDGTYRVECDSMLQSWDFSFKDKKSSDYVAGGVWAKRGADVFLIYQIWDRLSFTASLEAMLRVSKMFPQAHRKLVEDKANGTAIIDSLKKKLSGIIPIETGANGKLARAEAVSPFLRAGNVWLPTSDVATQIPQLLWDPEALILEATSFPNGAHDDQVDQVSQALAEFFIGPGGVGTINTTHQRLPINRGAVSMPRGAVTGSNRQRRLTEQLLKR